MAFCDYCPCKLCQEGDDTIFHAPTPDGRWICDVCYWYDLCTSAPDVHNGPCESEECPHRPIVGTWRPR